MTEIACFLKSVVLHMGAAGEGGSKAFPSAGFL